jgi:hypothetical protein
VDEIVAASAADDVVFLEALDKHDGLVARHRFERLPITLGAAYNCDHIVDAEPSKDRRPVAASITRSADGGLVVTASDGAPDFWAPGGMTRSWPVDPDQSFLLGGQRFRLRTRSYVTSPRASAVVLPGLGRWAAAWALPLALLCGAGITWLADIDGQGISAYISVALVSAGMLAVWAGVWAALSRLTGRASHFLAHLSLAALAVVAVIVLDYLFDTAAFAFNLPAIQRYDYALVGVIIGVLVWCHARLVTRLQPRTAVVAALAVGAAVLAFQALPAYTARGNIASTATLTEIRPPALRLAKAVSTDAFFAGSESLKVKTESTRPEKPEGYDFGSGSE